MFVKTWNIQGCYNINSNRRLEITSDIYSIMSSNTILLLQDVQADHLPISFNYEISTCNNLNLGGAGGCAIIMGHDFDNLKYDVTKDPAGRYLAVTFHTSPTYTTFISIYFPHYCSLGNARRNRGRYSSVCAIHSHPKDGRVGLFSDLMEWTITLDHPVVIGGDFNTSMEGVGGNFGREINRFKLDFVNSRDRQTPPTFPSSGNTIDHIFLTSSNLLYHKPYSIETVESLVSSDHNLVSIELVGGNSLMKMKHPARKNIRTNKRPLLNSYKEALYHDDVNNNWQSFQDQLEELIERGEPLADWIERVELFLGKLAIKYSQQVSSRRNKLGLPPSLILARDVHAHIKKVIRRPSSLNYNQTVKWRSSITNFDFDLEDQITLHQSLDAMTAYSFSQNDLDLRRLRKIKKRVSHLIQGRERLKLANNRENFSNKIQQLHDERKFKSIINLLLKGNTSYTSLHSIQSPGGHVTGEANTIPIIAKRLEHISSNQTIVNVAYYSTLTDGYQPPTQLPPPILQPASFIKLWRSKKKNTAPGLSGCTINALVAAPEQTQLAIGTALCKIWERREIIPHWRKKKVILLKKTDKPDYTQFRPIYLIEYLRKTLFGAIVKADWGTVQNRISRFQFGFMPGKGCDEVSSILTSIITCSLNDNAPLFALYLDISKAFDSVPFNVFPLSFELVGLHNEIIKFILQHEHGSIGIIEGNGKKKYSFNIKSGTPQGSEIGPIMWLLFLNPLLLSIEKKNNNQDDIPPLLALADDIVLLGRTVDDIQWMLDEVLSFTTNTGMKLSLSKCSLAWNQHTTFDQNTINWDGISMIGGGTYRHLGRSISLNHQNEESLAKVYNNIRFSLLLLERKQAPAEAVRYVMKSVLLPQLAYPLLFVEDTRIKQLDIHYRKVMRMKLHLHPRFSNALLTFPLGNLKKGIGSFEIELNQRRFVFLHRLLSSSSQEVRRSFSDTASLFEPSLTRHGFDTPETSQDWDIQHSLPSPPATSTTNIFFTTEESYCQIAINSSSSNFTIIQVNIPTEHRQTHMRGNMIALLSSIKIADQLHCHTKIYTKFISQAKFLESHPWKKARSLQIMNWDLWLEILLTLHNSSSPIEIHYKADSPQITNQPPTTIMNLPSLLYGNNPSSMVKLKLKMGEDMWLAYCYIRDTRFPKEWRWIDIDWEAISKVWLPFHSSSQVIYYLRLVMNYDFTYSRLHKYKVIDSPLCSCDQNVPETTKHVLLDCSNYEKVNFNSLLSLKLSSQLSGKKKLIVQEFNNIVSSIPSHEFQAKITQGILSKTCVKIITDQINKSLPPKMRDPLENTFHSSLIQAGKQITIERWKRRRKYINDNPPPPPPPSAPT